MASVTLKDLLEAGAHFGHQTQRWNPKMKRFILCPRELDNDSDGIADLQDQCPNIPETVNLFEDSDGSR